MRVEEPMLSIVATRRSAESRSGANVPSARHAPLNSSIPEMSIRMSGVIRRVSVAIMTPNPTPIYTHIPQPVTTPLPLFQEALKIAKFEPGIYDLSNKRQNRSKQCKARALQLDHSVPMTRRQR
jgi:hypothetical protein